MVKSAFRLSFILLLFLSACKSRITPDALYGKWKYVKLENPQANPPTSEPDWKLKAEDPYIEFKKDNSLEIWFSQKRLSHGTFKTEANKIFYKEMMEDGKTREFPFYVSQLSDNTLVFETLGEDGSRVTAEKK